MNKPPKTPHSKRQQQLGYIIKVLYEKNEQATKDTTQQAAKLLIHPHETHKHLPLRILEDKVPVHDTGNAVVIGQRVMLRGLKSSLSHGNE